MPLASIRHQKITRLWDGSELILTLAAVASLSASARVSDGLYFDLKSLGDLNGNGTADLSEVVNAMAVGATGGGAATFGDKLTFTSETKWRSFYNLASPERQAVNIRQDYYEVDVSGVKKWKTYQNAIVFQNPAATAPCVNGRTMFCRFRWDGYAYPDPAVTKNMAIVASDSWSWNGNVGYGFYINPYDANTSMLGVWVGQKNNAVKRSGSVFLVSSNKWHDVMFRLTTDGTKTQLKMTWGNVGTYDEWNGSAEFAAPLAADPNGRLVIGGENYGSYSTFSKTAQGPKSFNGRIAELKIWNRALSDEEAKAVFVGSWGETLSLGAANGSSDEFGANPQATFDPATMDCGAMRKELTADHPSLHIETAFKAEEDRLGKAILITPVLKDVAACPVQLYVNGQLSDETTLADGVETALCARRRLWKANDAGKIEIEIRRVGDLTGTLGIDALSFGGSWQLGKVDGDWSDFAWEEGSDAKENYYVGDTNTQEHLRRAIYETGGSHPQTRVTLNAYVPAALTGVKSILGFKFANKQTGTATSPWTLRLNGVDFWSKDLAKKEVVEVEIPAGTLKAGLNTFSFSHASPQANEWAGMDYYRLQFADKPRGMVLIFR